MLILVFSPRCYGRKNRLGMGKQLGIGFFLGTLSFLSEPWENAFNFWGTFMLEWDHPNSSMFMVKTGEQPGMFFLGMLSFLLGAFGSHSSTGKTLLIFLGMFIFGNVLGMGPSQLFHAHGKNTRRTRNFLGTFSQKTVFFFGNAYPSISPQMS